MVNPDEQNINRTWHELRENDRYLDPIKDIQQITITTSINNVYWYTRAMDDSIPPQRLENIWEVSKNYEPYLDDHNNRVKIDITTLDLVLSSFYEVLDPETMQPIEIPVKVVLH